MPATWQLTRESLVLSSSLVLVVDDEADVRALIQRIISRFRPDITVHTAPNGQVALFLCHQLLPALIISDVNMPTMDGIAFIMALRTAGMKTPVIIVSADPGYEQDALHAGADFFIYKPELFRALPPLLQQLLPHTP